MSSDEDDDDDEDDNDDEEGPGDDDSDSDNDDDQDDGDAPPLADHYEDEDDGPHIVTDDDGSNEGSNGGGGSTTDGDSSNGHGSGTTETATPQTAMNAEQRRGPGDDVEKIPGPWQRRKYEDKYQVPWASGKQDDRGDPLPQQPSHLKDIPSYHVEKPTEEQIATLLTTIGLHEASSLGDGERELFRHFVVFNYSLFDHILRPVDSEPVELQFKDKEQQPIKLQPIRLSSDKLDCLREQLKIWVRDGIVRPATSAWGFPILMLKKKGGKGANAFRAVIDFRKLNEVVHDNSFPNVPIEDALAFLHQKRWRTAADMWWGYHGLLLSKRSQDACTFVSALGAWSWNRLPLGVKPATGLFCAKLHTDLTKWLYQSIIAYVDDVLIAHPAGQLKEHIQVVVDAFSELAMKGWSVKPNKFKLLPETFVYLGHLSTPTGIQPTDAAIRAISEMPVPGTIPGRGNPKRAIRSFLGLGSYNRRYIKDFAKITRPLRTLTEEKTPFKWTPECQKAWDAVVAGIATSKGLKHPRYELPFYIRSDASSEGIGGYLFQIDPDQPKDERVIEYFSRTVPAAMRKYEPRRLELLAVLECLEHFRPIISGRETRLETDHKNLTFLRRQTHSSGQLARWAYRLGEFDNELLSYRAGKDMPVADELSRNPLPEEIELDEHGDPLSEAYAFVTRLGRADDEAPSGQALYKVSVEHVHEPVASDDKAPTAVALATTLTDAVFSPTTEPPGPASAPEPTPSVTMNVDRTIAGFNFIDQAADVITDDDVRAAQKDDVWCLELQRKKKPKNDPRRKKPAWFVIQDGLLWRVDQDNQRRMVVPEALRPRLIADAHVQPLRGHRGRDATARHLGDRFWWPRMAESVGEWINNNCIICAMAKSGKPLRQGLLQQPTYTGDGSALSIDLVGPLPESDGHVYLLTMLDPFSHFLVIEAVNTKQDAAIVDAFIKGIVLRGY
ncbi:MAG: RNase H-like domain-containing protein, partial [Planctomycetota bacterium]